MRGPGGSIRPTPSPDGKSLAFVRRVRFKTRALRQGPRLGARAAALRRPRPRHAGDLGDPRRLSRDGLDARQPRDRLLGRRARSAAWSARAAERRHPVPRQGHAPAAEAVRFPVEVAPDRFDVKMLRWVTVSPKGDRVVYQALGHIWVRATCPSGDAAAPDASRPITSSCIRPSRATASGSSTRPGTTRRLGTRARRAGRRGRGARRDGGAGPLPRARLLARRSEDRLPQGRRRLSRHARLVVGTGLYCVPAGGRRGRARVARTDSLRSSARRATASTSRSSSRPRRARAARGREARLAPAPGRRRPARALRLRQRHRVRDLARREVARLPRALQRLRHAVRPHRASGRDRPEGEVAAGGARLPGRRRVPALVRAIRRALHWSLGPELFTRELKEPSPFSPARPRSCPRPPANGKRRSASRPPRTSRRASSRSSARASSRCGGGDEVIEDGTVVVDGNRIVAVGPRADVAVPAGAPRRRRRGQDDHARHRRRALARRLRHRRHHPAAELVHLRRARLRRDHAARSVERHRRSSSPRAELARAGLILAPRHLLDRHHPLRRRRGDVQGGDRQPRRRARAPASA